MHHKLTQKQQERIDSIGKRADDDPDLVVKVIGWSSRYFGPVVFINGATIAVTRDGGLEIVDPPF